MTAAQHLRIDEHPFEFAMVPLGKIVPHPIVQRAIRLSHVERIAKTFDQNLLGVLSINKRGRDLLVFDGQHRAAAMKQYLGDGWQVVDVPCHIYKNLDDRACARIANGLNTFKLWTPIDRFRSEVTAGDPVALDITRLLLSFGVTVQNAASANTIRAVGVLRQIYGWKPDGRDALASTVGLLHEAWPDDVGALDGQLMLGTALLFQKHGHALDRRALLHKLAARRTADTVLGQGRQLAKATGYSTAQGVCAVLVRTYNTGRRTGTIEERAA